MTACLCSWGCKQSLEHPHGCSLGFSYTELLTWQRELENNCISTCTAQIYLDFDVSVQTLSFLYGDYFLTLIKCRWKQGEFFDTLCSSPHIHPSCDAVFANKHSRWILGDSEKKLGETITICQCHWWKRSRSLVLYPNIVCSCSHLYFPLCSSSSDRMAVSVSNSCFWCLIPYKLKDMEKGSFSAEKSLLPWKGSRHDGVFHITQGL